MGKQGPKWPPEIELCSQQTVILGSRRVVVAGSHAPTHAHIHDAHPNTHTLHAMDVASSGQDTSERHEQLVVLLAAAMRRRRERKLVRTVTIWRVVLRSYPDDDDDLDDIFSGHGDNAPPAKRKRTVLPRRDYKASFWWNILGETGLKDPGSTEARLFRRRFRIPYQVFRELIKLVQEKKWFSTREKDVAGRPCIPVELKVKTLSYFGVLFVGAILASCLFVVRAWWVPKDLTYKDAVFRGTTPGSGPGSGFQPARPWVRTRAVSNVFMEQSVNHVHHASSTHSVSAS